ncbi:MAG: hypothetical protein ACE5F7_00610 [Nitrospiria bacterium]
MKKRKAIALLSGGLDSTLAAKLIIDQGIDVIGLFLESPFGCKENVEGVAKHLGIPLRIVDKGMAFVELIRNPKYGYGKNINPCIDCRIYMFHIAERVMHEEEADFIVTGEVLGQRPMSQRREAMDIIDRDSETEGLVLRPLSAQHNLPTKAETEGWVDRKKLLALSGRSRTEQLKWAETLQLKEYTAPAGGCLLTDANFSVRLHDFFEHRENPTMTEVRLLRYGRHFDLTDGSHLVIGRNASENDQLETISKNDVKSGGMTFFRPAFSGPTAVLSGTGDNTALDEAIRLIAKYSKKGLTDDHIVEVHRGNNRSEIKIHFPPADAEALPVLP